ncbi:hypothetical protein GCM10007049_34690 [Echinicola pacifica]|uniref:2'-5' RNA ligase n=1 Tax=Echinicola pacifica TaxID=346377 RepID=A0A918UWB6_9BACT|nr:mutarotase [Echinicola pacifica]GGZ38596.1 hypothetical protein GCM10007049_34690 [Echinicola pacifica]
MDLKAHYQSLFDASMQKLELGQYEMDSLIDSPRDLRRGITVLARPDAATSEEIIGFLGELKSLDPQQYYYPAPDLHLTILSLISCYSGFQLDQIQPEEYIQLIQSSLTGLSPFRVRFQGVTLSPAGLLVKGYPEDQSLQYLREVLRYNFKASPLEQSLDKRYTIQTAHSTIMRYRKPLAKISEFMAFVQENKDRDFGSFEISCVELVYNDWYQRAQNVQLLARIDLQNKTVLS